MTRSTSQRALTEQLESGQRTFSHETSSIAHVQPNRSGTVLRILYIDDEPDIREVVELSLALDPVFTVRSCASGGEGLAAASEWQPDLILCDVMMPVMDGPATLARLRENPQTACIPVVFMTARAQKRELDHFKSLGAVGVISKPFDPMTLAASMRKHLRAAGLSALRSGFMRRLQADGEALARCRADLATGDGNSAALAQIGAFAHALAGAAGIFGFTEISRAAADLEIAAEKHGDGGLDQVERSLDGLLSCIGDIQNGGAG